MIKNVTLIILPIFVLDIEMKMDSENQLKASFSHGRNLSSIFISNTSLNQVSLLIKLIFSKLSNKIR